MANLVEKTEPMRVSVSAGFTRNLGNFESMRIDIGVEDSARSGEKAMDTFNRVYDFVEKRLLEKFPQTEAKVEEKR